MYPKSSAIVNINHTHSVCVTHTQFAKMCKCDMIKKNESDVEHVVFEILAKTVFKFLCNVLF